MLGLALVFVVAILWAGHLTQKMERQSSVLTNVFSRFISETAFQADRPGASEIIRNIVEQVDLPMILTDVTGVPLVWHGVGVPPNEAIDPQELGREELQPEMMARRQRLDELVRRFDADNKPWPIVVAGSVQGYVHFGSSGLEQQLRWMPWILVLTVAIFISVGMLGVRSLKRGEQRLLWVGMARETAHQLGTPLTSLLGWVQLLRSTDAPLPDETAEAAQTRRAQTYSEMSKDLERLSKVSARFSRIGGALTLMPLDLVPIITETVDYVRRRTPHLGAQVEIHEAIGKLPLVAANPELIEWVFENLLKNAVDAMPEGGGEIWVRSDVSRSGDKVELRVADTGRGISPGRRNRIWEPGFSTKDRGWGLGLTLVRRIVVEYHSGQIWLEDNEDRRGICFVIQLPAAPETTGE
jgi:NtrC-family two-component system sensor histidine kinase KinB